MLLLTVNSYSQTTIHKNWVAANKGEWGSFYWGVSKSNSITKDGKYYYYVYFYSNSYFNTKRNDGYNYDKASTYIRNVSVYMLEYKTPNGIKFNTVLVNLPFVTCDWFYDVNLYGAWFWSYYPYNDFYITFDKASAFDYSIY